MLAIKSVKKSFGNIQALDTVSFDVAEGEFVFVTGPSGAGKTTLLRLILREMLPDEGEIILNDRDITKLKSREIPTLRQEIGVVFQDFKILPEKTLRENVEVALAVIGLPKDEWAPRVEHVLGLVDLSDRMELFPSQLSGGELQRASLARALVVNPKIILADEPTGNLDWETADKLMELFEKINKEGKTVVVATHHQIIIDKMSKREIKLKKGKVQNEGAEKPDESPAIEKEEKKADKKNKIKSNKGKQ